MAQALPFLSGAREWWLSLDACEKLLRARAHFCEGGRWAMDRVVLGSLDGAQLIDWLSNDVHDPPPMLALLSGNVVARCNFPAPIHKVISKGGLH